MTDTAPTHTDPNAQRPGYRLTKLGWLPEEWEVSKIADQAKIIGRIGFRGYTREDIVEKGQGAITLNPGNILDGTLLWDELNYISWEKYEESPEIKINNGDVLIVKTGFSTGKTCLVKNLDYPTTINPQICVLKEIQCDPVFLAYQCLSSSFQKQIKKSIGIGAVLSTSQSQIEKFLLPLPPLAEQRAIAAILSTWDRAIAQTQALLGQLRQRNRGLAQRLLTGEMRLKGFEGAWEWLRADAIFKNVSIKNHPNEELLAVTQERGVIPRDMLEGRVTMPSGDRSGFKLVQPGDFVISLRSFQGGLEYSKYRGLVSPAYTVLGAIRDISDEYFQHYFKSHHFIGHLATSVIGIRDGKQISFKDFQLQKLPYPPLPEQQAIARVLQAAEAEVQGHTARLSALQDQKRGLMQGLLTGRVRVAM